MPGQLGRSVLPHFKEMLGHLSLALTFFSSNLGSRSPSPAPITIRIRLLQCLHDSGRGSTRALLAPSAVASQTRFQPLRILDPMKHCSACVCMCVRVCVPRPTTWPDSGSLSGAALGVPESELQSGKWGFRNHCGLDSPSVAGGERIRGTRRLWVRALVTPLPGVIYLC